MNIEQHDMICWARHILTHKSDFFLLDTETTGLHECEIVEIAAISLEGEILLNTRVKPTIKIPPEVSKIHGIYDKDVEKAPGFTDIYPMISNLFKDRRAIIYNAAFDAGVLEHVCSLHALESLRPYDKSVCLMHAYAQFVGEFDLKRKGYKLHKLGGGHSALSDCQKALQLLLIMANDNQGRECPSCG